MNNIPVPRTETYIHASASTCIEGLLGKKHIDTICARVGEGTEVMKRLKPLYFQCQLSISSDCNRPDILTRCEFAYHVEFGFICEY